MRMLYSGLAMLALALSASAATIGFNLAPATNETPGNTSATVSVTNDGVTCPANTTGCVQVSVNFNSGSYSTFDITGVFFEMANSITTVNPFSINGLVPTVGYNSESAPNNAQVNPLGNQIPNGGGSFDVALGIGSLGVGQGDIYTSAVFGLQAAGLDPTDFLAAAVRVQSIGTAGLSGKYFDPSGSDQPGDDPVVPEPSTYALLGSALVGLAVLHRKRK